MFLVFIIEQLTAIHFLSLGSQRIGEVSVSHGVSVQAVDGISSLLDGHVWDATIGCLIHIHSHNANKKVINYFYGDCFSWFFIA